MNGRSATVATYSVKQRIDSEQCDERNSIHQLKTLQIAHWPAAIAIEVFTDIISILAEPGLLYVFKAQYALVEMRLINRQLKQSSVVTVAMALACTRLQMVASSWKLFRQNAALQLRLFRRIGNMFIVVLLRALTSMKTRHTWVSAAM